MGKSKKEFKALLEKYLNDTCTTEEAAMIDAWFDLVGKEQEPQLTQEEKAVLGKKMWNEINNEIDINEKPVIAFWRSGFFRIGLGIAASLIIGLVFVFNIFNGDAISSLEKYTFNKLKGLEEYKNNSTGVQRVALEDGSEILLDPQSVIYFPSHFTKDKREVYLEGRAFFDIEKNPEKPFFIYTGKVVTQVLGTSFWIDAIDIEKAVEVRVRTGKVWVYRQSSSQKEYGKKGVVLTPNQKTVYRTEQSKFVTGLIEKPVILDTAVSYQFIYKDEPLTMVLNELEKMYGIDIVTANDDIKACTFTGDVSMPILESKLEVVCKAIGAKYKVSGTKILIEGEGCK